MQAELEIKLHTRAQSFVFKGKSVLLQARRAFINLFDSKLKNFSKGEALRETQVVAESKTPLWTESRAEEQFLLAGKVQNLRIAVKRLNGLEIPAGEVFSFWKHVGRASRLKGF